MTGPGQPRTCSHPINAQMLTGVCPLKVLCRWFNDETSIYGHFFINDTSDHIKLPKICDVLKLF